MLSKILYALDIPLIELAKLNIKKLILNGSINTQLRDIATKSILSTIIVHSNCLPNTINRLTIVINKAVSNSVIKLINA